MKKISHIFTLMLFYFCCLIANSQEKQEIKILDFKQVSNFHIDYAKEFAYQESNRDSTIWALLIVETNDPNIRVISSESNPGHYVWEELRKNPRFNINEHRMPGEIWYSLRPGAKQFRVAHSLYRHDTDIPALYNREGKHIGRLISNWYIPPSKMLGEYGLVEAGKTYRLKIEVPQTFSAPDKDADPGFVTFSTDPVGALVTLMKNGEVKASGKTNPDYSFSLSYGEYMYVVSAENHHSASGTIRVGETPTTRSIKLRPITGKLTVMSSPSGADVIIGVKKYGVTPLNIDSLVVGEHEVTIGKVGYGEVKEKVVVAENERASINAQITSGNEITPTPLGTLTPQWAPEVTAKQKRIIGELIESMVMVEGGTFTMGATSEQGSDVSDSEKPTHRVTLSDYYIGAYEVTQEQWQAVMGKNPSKFKGNRKPVERVSYNDIVEEFLPRLEHLTGLKFSLPTEAQWEYAARGGNKSRGYKYSGSNDINSVAWYKNNASNETHPVGQKQANELGLYDMSGNVWEWCQDWKGDYSSSSQTNPTGPSTGSYRVFRGGSWDYGARFCRVSYRNYYTPGSNMDIFGLRLAINIDENSDVNHDEVVSIPGGLMPRWSSSATAEQKRILGELIESMVMVEGGTFTMGATSEQGGDAYDDEKPTHRVTLSDYYIGKYEVTQEQWQAVMGSNPSSYKGSRKPVESVSYKDCEKFIDKLNKLTGLNFKLPTEAQWEYAARGGNKSRGYKYSGGNDLYSVGWFGHLNTYGDNKGNSGGETHPVGQKAPNELGLYDMSGNVWEWCSDWYGSSYYSSSPSTDPTGPSTGSARVLRGGCWGNRARFCRVSYRLKDTPDSSYDNLGLRLVASQF